MSLALRFPEYLQMSPALRTGTHRLIQIEAGYRGLRNLRNTFLKNAVMMF